MELYVGDIITFSCLNFLTYNIILGSQPSLTQCTTCTINILQAKDGMNWLRNHHDNNKQNIFNNNNNNDSNDNKKINNTTTTIIIVMFS